MATTPNQFKPLFAASKADRLGPWVHKALADWGCAWDHFKDSPASCILAQRATLGAMTAEPGHNPHEAYLLHLWQHELAHVLEVRQCRQAPASYVLPNELDPANRANWPGIALRCEWRLHVAKVEWDWQHFADVVQPWAVTALDAYAGGSDPVIEEHTYLGKWMSTQLVWSGKPELLEPLARKLGQHVMAHRNDSDKPAWWGKHVACDLDWWEQKTGVALGIAHGGWFWHVPGSVEWKKLKRPRTAMPR